MREALEKMRDALIDKLDDSSTALVVFDDVTAIIDTAMDALDQGEPNAVVEIVPLAVMEERLETLLTRFFVFKKADRKARTTKRRDTKRDSKKRSVARKGARKVKGKR